MANKLPSVIRGRQIDIPLTEDGDPEIVVTRDGRQFAIMTDANTGRRYLDRNQLDGAPHRPSFVQNIIINGDYHYRDAANAWAVWGNKKDRKLQRQLQLDDERRDREDRRERLERQSWTFTLLGFFSYLVILVVIAAMVSGLAALGMIHH